MLPCAVTRPWPRRLDGRRPSSRCCSPIVAATLARAAHAPSVGRRIRDGSALGHRSTRRPSLPVLNSARLVRRASLRSPTPVAARLDGRPPSSRCCSPLVMATLERADRARLVGRRARDDSTLGPRWTRRPAPPALNAVHLLRRASLRGHTPVAATYRRPPAVESLLLAAHRGDSRACCSRPLGRPQRSRQLDTRPSLDAAAFADCAAFGESLAPCSSALEHARGRDGSTDDRRQVAAARRSSRRTRVRCSRPLGWPPHLRRLDTWPSLDAAACASCAARGPSLAPCFFARSPARGRDGSTAAHRQVAAARRSSRRRSRALLAPAQSAAAFATARHAAVARCGGLRLLR